jgi:hypothetical protein
MWEEKRRASGVNRVRLSLNDREQYSYFFFVQHFLTEFA